MKKKVSILMMSLLFLFLTACGSEEGSNNSGSSKEKSSSKGELATEDYDKMYSDPKKYKGYEVEQVGTVFTEPEFDEDGVYLQVFADAKNSEKNTLIKYSDPSFKVESGQYIKWTGIVKDEFTGENLMGGKVTAPAIEATKMEVISYFDAVSPTIATLDINEIQEQHGFELTVDKVEIAEDQFRVYVSVENKSDYNISFYTFNTKLLVDGKQLEEIDLYEEGIEEVQTDILPGAQTSGVIVYPSVGDTKEVKFYAEGSSDNYDIDIDTFVFDLNLESK